jgi:flagellar basal body P-ring formation protein FlgA
MRRCFDARLLFICAALCAAQPSARAQHSGSSGATQDPTELTTQAARAARASLAGTDVETEILVRPTPLDARLQLAACSAPLATRVAPIRAGMTRTLVRVSCEPQQWSVNVSVDVAVRETVLVARVPIARGTALSATDFSSERREIPGITSRAVRSGAEFAHLIARRPLAPGELLTVDATTPAIIVKRGQPVTLLATANGIAIQAPGKALADASLAGRVRVQNLSSLRTIEGVVESADTVRVGP